MPSMTARMRKSLFLAAVTLVLSLAAGELLLWRFFPVEDPFERLKLEAPKYIPSQFPPNARMETRAEPGLPGMTGEPKVFSTNGYGFRGDTLSMPKPEGELRVFLIGGSAAECLYLDDSEGIHAVLQKELSQKLGRPVKVYGAGKSGDKSFDHVAALAHRIVHLEPDWVIVFCGFNDLLGSLHRADYLHFATYKKKYSAGVLLKLLATELQIPRYVYYSGWMGKDETSEPENVTLQTRYRDLATRDRVKKTEERSLPLAEEAYGRNLATLAGIAKANGFNMVFMTQPTSWNAPEGDATRRWHWLLFGRAEADMDRAMEALNQVMRRTAEGQGTPVFDAVRFVSKSQDFFYDDVHFHAAGAAVVGKELARFLAERITTLKQGA